MLVFIFDNDYMINDGLNDTHSDFISSYMETSLGKFKRNGYFCKDSDA